MAQIIRTAKSGSSWGKNELKGYNIAVHSVDPSHFFHGLNPPIGHIDHAIRNAPPGYSHRNISDIADEYLSHLYLATTATTENFIDSFVVKTMELLGFRQRTLALSSHVIIPLAVAGDPGRAA